MASMDSEKKARLHAAYLQADLNDAELNQVHKEMTDMVTQSDPGINAENFVSEVFPLIGSGTMRAWTHSLNRSRCNKIIY